MFSNKNVRHGNATVGTATDQQGDAIDTHEVQQHLDRAARLTARARERRNRLADNQAANSSSGGKATSNTAKGNQRADTQIGLNFGRTRNR